MHAFLQFPAVIEIIGINPFVFIPGDLLQQLFQQAGKSKGAIPVKMTIDGYEFDQTLVKYAGHWRLYLNQPMRTAAGKELGDQALFGLRFDPAERKIPIHPKLKKALAENVAAGKVYEELTPSHQKEIARYINNLKTEASVDRNIERAINYLLGKERFAGRDPGNSK